jgi:hypothetical protein
LRRYPPQDHTDFPLPANVVFFCQPEGALTASGKRQATQPATSFVFALTDKDTNRVRYGVCLNFFRVLRRRPHRSKLAVQSASSNRSLPIDDNNNQADAEEADLESSAFGTEAEDTTGDSDAARSPINSPLPGPPIASRPSRRSRSHTQLSSLNSICLITHHPFFASFRECLFAIKSMLQSLHSSSKGRHRRRPSNRSMSAEIPCANCRNNNDCDCESSGNDSKPDLWNVLTGNASISSADVSDEVREQIRLLDTFVMRLLSAPIPMPGSTKIEVRFAVCSV